MNEEAKALEVSGPVTGGKRGWPFAKSLLDAGAYDYVEEEFFLEGTAMRYRTVPGTEHSHDGLWHAEPSGGSAPFKTRVLVYRPRDASRFNGTVILTWNNVTAGFELFSADSLEVFEGGFALVCLTTQKAGIEGLPPVKQGLADWDPERYGSLSIASDDDSFDIYTQAARAFGPSRPTQGVDPMGGLAVQRVVAYGASQSAARLATYLNAVQPLARALDGFILAIHFGGGTSLEVGEAVVNPGAGKRSAPLSRSKSVLRDDLGVPVFLVNSELEANACYDVRQPDSDTFRYWESAGTAHVSAQTLATRWKLAQRDELVTRRPTDGINTIPMTPLYDAAIHHMHRWLSGEGAPPVQPRLEFAGDPPSPVRDEHGIARGGVRLPQADVPLEENSATPRSPKFPAVLEGSSAPFSREKVLSLYGDRERFVELFEQAARAAVAAGTILPREVAGMVAEAGAKFAQIVSDAPKA